MLNGLDLFSGGGFAAEALASWKRNVAYCERGRLQQAVLLSRMLRGEIDTAPIWDDVTTLRGNILPEIDIISAGFPCTNISLAGRREGLAGSESQLFWHVQRIAYETKAPIIFLENVWPGIRKHIPIIRNEIESLGYECRDGVLSAAEVGARHKRARWFMFAYNNKESKKRIQSGRRIGKEGSEAILSELALEKRKNSDANSERVSLCRNKKRIEQKQPFNLGLLEGNNWDEYASFFLRMDNGHPYRGDRIGIVGNGVVPIQEETAFEILMGFMGVKSG